MRRAERELPRRIPLTEPERRFSTARADDKAPPSLRPLETAIVRAWAP